MRRLVTILALMALCPWAESLADTLNGREVCTDGQGRILPWFDPAPERAFPHMIDLSVEFLLQDVPLELGLPMYYCRSMYNRFPPHQGYDWYSNPSDLAAGFIRAYVLGYEAFSGDASLRPEVEAFARYMADQGSTPVDPSWAWPGCPYSHENWGVLPPRGSNLDGTVMPHLIGKLGCGQLELYLKTEDPAYLQAARACADALSANVRSGTATISPWPFRVYPESGAVYQANEYCADVVDPIRLLEGLIDLGEDVEGEYESARSSAWSWMLSPLGPVATGNWSNFFEDTSFGMDNDCQINQGETAHYLLERPDRDPDWESHTRQLIQRMEDQFGEQQYGAWVMAEQVYYPLLMISHTARYASVCALMYRRTGEPAFREKALRSLAWSTYGSCPEKPRVLVETMDNPAGWFSDCHADYVPHLMSILESIPDWAPAGEDHILGSSSVIQSVEYGAGEILYSTYHPRSTEALRTAQEPRTVLAGAFQLPRRTDLEAEGWTWEPLTAGGILRIRHDDARSIQVSDQLPAPVSVALSMPAHLFRPGDECFLSVVVHNPWTFGIEGLPLFVLLEVAGVYWFAPGWGSEPDSYHLDYLSGETELHAIPPFLWPEGAGAGDGALFWAALTDAQVSELASNLDSWEFGWRE